MHPKRFQNDFPAQTPATSREAVPFQARVAGCPQRMDSPGRSCCRAAPQRPHQQSHRGAQSLLQVAQAVLTFLLQPLRPSALPRLPQPVSPLPPEPVQQASSQGQADLAGTISGWFQDPPELQLLLSKDIPYFFPGLSAHQVWGAGARKVPRTSQPAPGRQEGTATRESRQEHSLSYFFQLHSGHLTWDLGAWGIPGRSSG